jgi:hypothetical protein
MLIVCQLFSIHLERRGSIKIIVRPALHCKSALVPRLRAFHCNQGYVGKGGGTETWHSCRSKVNLNPTIVDAPDFHRSRNGGGTALKEELQQLLSKL